MSGLDAWLDEPGQCRPCHGPIVAKTKLGMVRDYICWLIIMVWPMRFFMRGPMPMILPYAGTHAYTCTCWSKIAQARPAQPQSEATSHDPE